MFYPFHLIIIFLDTPGEPVGPIVFTNISEGKVTFSWNPPENDGCSEVTHYVIEKRETSKISWTLVTDHCEECIYNATKLIKTNEYQFRVSAVNRFGVSRPLDSVPVIAQMQYSKCICRLYSNFSYILVTLKKGSKILLFSFPQPFQTLLVLLMPPRLMERVLQLAGLHQQMMEEMQLNITLLKGARRRLGDG